MSLIDMKHRA